MEFSPTNMPSEILHQCSDCIRTMNKSGVEWIVLIRGDKYYSQTSGIKRIVSNSMNPLVPSLSALQISPSSNSQVAVNIATKLQDAAAGGHHSKVLTYITDGVAVDEMTDESEGRTPLFYAAEYGRRQVARVLLEHGAAVDHQDINGLTALMVASEWGYASFARILVENNADVNYATPSRGVTALMVSAKKGSLGVTRTLLELRAEVDQQSKMSDTALMIAADNGHHSVCATLLGNRANVNHANPSKYTVLMGSTGFLTVRTLALWGANVDSFDIFEHTALMYFARAGRHKSIAELLRAGASVNLAGANLHKTALTLALEWRNPLCVIQLLKAGASISHHDLNTAIEFSVAELAAIDSTGLHVRQMEVLDFPVGVMVLAAGHPFPPSNDELFSLETHSRALDILRLGFIKFQFRG